MARLDAFAQPKLVRAETNPWPSFVVAAAAAAAASIRSPGSPCILRSPCASPRTTERSGQG